MIKQGCTWTWHRFILELQAKHKNNSEQTDYEKENNDFKQEKKRKEKNMGTTHAVHMSDKSTKDLKSTWAVTKAKNARVYVGLLKRWAFKSRLKLARLFACLKLAGSLFYTHDKVGETTENALLP